MPIYLNKFCPCGSKEALNDCCGRYLKGREFAPAPVALMRSRYTAYTLQNFDYIAATMQGKPLEGFNKLELKKSSKNIRWVELQVVNVSPIENDKGFVEFRAYYIKNNKKYCLSEISEFHRINGKWYYVDGSV